MRHGAITGDKKITDSSCTRVNTVKTNDTEIGADGCSTGDHNLAAVLKAMAHPVRIRILHLLSDSDDSLCSCDIESHFPLRQPTISHHMKILKDAGLIESWQEGSWVHYTLSETPPVPVREIIKQAR